MIGVDIKPIKKWKNRINSFIYSIHNERNTKDKLQIFKSEFYSSSFSYTIRIWTKQNVSKCGSQWIYSTSIAVCLSSFKLERSTLSKSRVESRFLSITESKSNLWFILHSTTTSSSFIITKSIGCSLSSLSISTTKEYSRFLYITIYDKSINRYEIITRHSTINSCASSIEIL